MAICGNAAGYRWMDFHIKSGTTVFDTVTFRSSIIADLPAGQTYTFLCDNLSSHKHQLVTTAIYYAGHQLLFCPPYCPWLGPIEYVFNNLQQELTIRMHEVTDGPSLRAAVGDIVHNMGLFQGYFAKCLP
jgi:DDE superfamily endonuclease